MSSGYSIAFIELSTGISRETLRMWERRYGFPMPDRDANGDRCYSPVDLDRLRLIKRLLDQGYRPGRIIPMSARELAGLEAGTALEISVGERAFEEFLGLLRLPGTEGARDWMQRRMSLENITLFTTGTVAVLTEVVGNAWAAGRLCVHEEHLYTEMVSRLLRQAIDSLPPGKSPTVVLATLPEERHGLGLMMAETLLRSEGATCMNLGVDMPIQEIVLAVNRHQADVLALSFSPAYPRRRVMPQIEALREQLPLTCRIWAGGRATAKFRSQPGVRFCPELEELSALLNELRLGEPMVEMG